MSQPYQSPFEAAQLGDLEYVRKMIDNEEDLFIRSKDGGTLLHYAASKLHYRVVLALLKAGLKADIKDKSGYLPEDWAYMENEFRMGCASEPAREFIDWFKSEVESSENLG